MDGQPDSAHESPDDLRYSYIHAAVLFADIENSVMLSATLPPLDYDNLLNGFQAAMQQLVDDLKAQGLPVAEFAIAGDQLSLFLYDPAEVERNRGLDGPDALQGEARAALIEECKRANRDLLYSAFQAAIQLKNRWLVMESNLERVRAHREPLGIGIGMHAGRVYLRKRPDGRRRIEGFAVNLAKRVEGFARQGEYSKIMFSQEAHDELRGIVRGHTQLRQRIFFHRHDVSLELLKGITESQTVFELKFFSRLKVDNPAEVIKQYEDMFYINPRNIWAYYQLFEYFAYKRDDWDWVFKAVKRALLAYPQDEKLLLDLSRYYFQQGDLRLADTLAKQALALNPEFDLVYEQLAAICHDVGSLDEQLAHMCSALALAPGSPVNHLNLGIALCESGDRVTGERHLLEALKGYPEYARHPDAQAQLQQAYDAGLLSADLAARFSLRLAGSA